ncbi:hypothetical protein LIX60_28620 [Streptomyces sp. S07_1.15]|uniref:hypothetical protein n=1 Tax=Streptomyces sp. S07_1.15 TaxID=2873925 RepID=UPI001D14C362|nr:hypothetical protein [Streptomyces sp. S07_1.15]MCC3655354.1 hypothetical protein [Streptomyces sp. S07_1.15]
MTSIDRPAMRSRGSGLSLLLRTVTAVQKREDARPRGLGARHRLSRRSEHLFVCLWAAGILPICLIEPHFGTFGQLVIGLAVAGGVTFMVWHESSWVRVQVLCAVAVACAVEFVGTHGMEWWDYRLGNLPAWVPPGHAGIFLISVILARTPAPRWLHHAAYAGLTAWSLWGLLLAERTDYSGVFGLLVIAAVRQHPVMRARIPWIIAVTVPCEFAGTLFGLYSYRPHDVTGLLLMGNPPSGLPGGYALVDFAALLMAGAVHQAWHRHRGSAEARSELASPPPAQ